MEGVSLFLYLFLFYFFSTCVFVMFYFVLKNFRSKVSSQVDSSSRSLLTSLVTHSRAVTPMHTVTTPSQNVTPSSVTPSRGTECALASSDSGVKATSERLKAAVEEAKMQSER